MKDFFENNCEVVRDILPLYADGGCSGRTGKLIRKHLDMCPSCRKYYKNVKRTVEKAGEEIPVSVPDFKELSKKIKHRRAVYTSVITSAFLLIVASNVIYFLTDDK